MSNDTHESGDVSTSNAVGFAIGRIDARGPAC